MCHEKKCLGTTQLDNKINYLEKKIDIDCSFVKQENIKNSEKTIN